MRAKATWRRYVFKGKVWKFKGKAGWYFVTLPRNLSLKIRKNHGRDEEGWGRLKASAKIGQSTWQTAIWYDSKFKSYLLPIKTQIRKVNKIENNSTITVGLSLEYSPILRSLPIF